MDPRPFHVLSLCAGIGGIDLGLKLALPDARTICYVENEATAAEKLVARMEDGALDEAPVWTNLKTFDGKPWRGRVHCLTSGYPCQPFSCAGQQRGVKDPRHLWPHVARVIRQVQPEWVFLENVSNHIRIGFRQVARELRAMGYEVEAGLFSAAEVGAPHLRKRLFVLAHSENYGYERRAGMCADRERPLPAEQGADGGRTGRAGESIRRGESLAHSESAGREARDGIAIGIKARLTNPLDYRAHVAHGDSGRLPDVDARSRNGRQNSGGRSKALAHPARDEQPGPPRQDGRGRGICEAGDTLGAQSQTIGQRSGIGRSHCAELAHAALGGCGELRQSSGRDGFSDGSGEELANAERLAAYSQGVANNKKTSRLGRNKSIRSRTLFPPGPEDLEAWRRLLADHPALEPAFRRAPHGVSARVDRLRTLGNGVVPLVAALAFRTLESAFADDGEPARTIAAPAELRIAAKAGS